jgi:hypothetical protein
MQKRISLALGLALSLVCAGCVGSGPNTQNGAVAGGAIGALTGAIIGNNSGGRNGLAGALIGGTVGAIAGGAIGNSIDHENGTIYGSEAQATTTVVVQNPPPPPPQPADAYMGPPPFPNAVWINGYWAWTGQGYQWAAGHWIQAPPGGYTIYVAPHWRYRPDGTYVYIGGYWRH